MPLVRFRSTGRFLLLPACCIFSVVVSAQEIRVAPLLKAGDEFGLEIKRLRRDSANPSQNAMASSQYDVRVVEAEADGFVLEFTRRNETTSDGAKSSSFNSAPDFLEGLPIRVLLTRDGEYAGLENEEDVLSQMRRSTDAFVREALQKVPPDQRATSQKMAGQLFSPTMLLTVATTDIQTYFGLAGFSLNVGKVTVEEIEQVNPLGGKLVPGRFRAAVDAVSTDSVSITTTTSYDVTEVLRSLTTIAAQNGKPFPESELAKLVPELSDEGRWILDRRFGLMREVIIDRRVIMTKEHQRFDRWEIRLLRTPKR